MKLEIQTLHDVWMANKAVQATHIHQMAFNELTNSIISTGPFSFFIIDFCDMSISHISDSLFEMFDLDRENITLNNILSFIHPDDIGFVAKAEDFLARFFLEELSRKKLLRYKNSYNFRVRVKNGAYVLFNHQALMLTLDENDGYGKSLNILTRIDHLSTTCNYKVSLIGLHGEPSYMNLSVDENADAPILFSKREMDIIRNISEGLSSIEIAQKLFITESTVKKHRNNILNKANCKNTAHLIRVCILQGLI